MNEFLRIFVFLACLFSQGLLIKRIKHLFFMFLIFPVKNYVFMARILLSDIKSLSLIPQQSLTKPTAFLALKYLWDFSFLHFYGFSSVSTSYLLLLAFQSCIHRVLHHLKMSKCRNNAMNGKYEKNRNVVSFQVVPALLQ